METVLKLRVQGSFGLADTPISNLHLFNVDVGTGAFQMQELTAATGG